ncbi:MAG TPA: hypothetical protein VJ932_03920 [Alkalispirochaeta sp.]|nr:hypothetical protein [Alkalispirochaeta sp.]
MAKLAVVILCDTETHADHGRLTNALELVKETNQQGGDARIVFDGGHPSLHGYIAKGYQVITF